MPRCGNQECGEVTPPSSASRTNSASDPARIFSMTRPRCTLTIFSLTPSSDAICLLSIPVTTSAKTSASRAVKLPSA